MTEQRNADETVFILTYGDYEDTTIVGVFSTFEQAQEYLAADLLAAANAPTVHRRIEYPRIAGHALNPELPESVKGE